MVKLALHSIAYEAKTLNLAKAGYTAFYVDGTDGLDIHDGGSWGQAFKTIQHAIDESESWARIFVKAGTYSENVAIDDKQGIHIIGENRETTIINGSAGAALYGNTTRSVFKEITIKTTSSTYLTNLTGVRNRIQSCVVDSSGTGAQLSGDYSTIDDVRVDSVGGIWPAISLGGNYGQLSNCIVDCSSGNGITLLANTHYAKVFGNTVIGVGASGYGIQANAATTTHNTIFHNNLISNAVQISENGSNNKWFENYYDNHTTDSNNDGLTDTAYTEGGATDYQPVSRRNGWKQESIGNTPGKNVSTMEFWSDMDVSVALTTSTANLTLPDVVIADIPSDTTIIRVIGMIDIREIVNTSGSGANALTASAVINVKKSSGSWGTDDVALINFPDNSWNVLASTRRVARMFVGDNNASSEVDENATYNLRFDGNVFVDYFTLGLVDVAVGLRVYFTA